MSKEIGYNEKVIEIDEYTTEELWINSKQQIFRVSVDDADIDSIAVFQDCELVHIITEEAVSQVLILDLNSDGKYEICTTSSGRFGFVRNTVKLYDTENNVEYDYHFEMNPHDFGAEYYLHLIPNENQNKLEVYFEDLLVSEGGNVGVLNIVFDQVENDSSKAIKENDAKVEEPLKFKGVLRLLKDGLIVAHY